MPNDTAIQQSAHAPMTDAVSQPVPTVRSLFFTMVPPELRNRIYREVPRQSCPLRKLDGAAVEVSARHVRGFQVLGRVNPALLRVSKVVHKEANAVFLRSIIFAATASGWKQLVLRATAPVCHLRFKLDDDGLALSDSIVRRIDLITGVRTITFDCGDRDVRDLITAWNQSLDQPTADFIGLSADGLRCEDLGSYILPIKFRNQVWHFEHGSLVQAWQHLKYMTPQASQREKERYESLSELTWPTCTTYEECLTTLQDCNATQLCELVVGHTQVVEQLHVPNPLDQQLVHDFGVDFGGEVLPDSFLAALQCPDMNLVTGSSLTNLLAHCGIFSSAKGTLQGKLAWTSRAGASIEAQISSST